MPDPHPLLELQRIDSADDALCRERETLPERASLAENQVTLARLAAEREAARDQLVALGREERRFEGEVATLREHAQQVEATLYSGTVTAVSELEGLQAQLTSLREQQDSLEQEEMGVLEQQETLEREIVQLDQRSVEIEKHDLALSEALEVGETRIDGMLAALARQRDAQLPKVPGSGLAVYRKLRGSARLGGLAAVPLEKNLCGACRTALPINHVERIRAGGPDEVVRCENCQRVVLTPTAP